MDIPKISVKTCGQRGTQKVTPQTSAGSAVLPCTFPSYQLS